MFRDAIEPELVKMKREMSTYHKVRRGQVISGMAAIAASVLIRMESANLMTDSESAVSASEACYRRLSLEFSKRGTQNRFHREIIDSISREYTCLLACGLERPLIPNHLVHTVDSAS
jgi:hypothetical protein